MRNLRAALSIPWVLGVAGATAIDDHVSIDGASLTACGRATFAKRVE